MEVSGGFEKFLGVPQKEGHPPNLLEMLRTKFLRRRVTLLQVLKLTKQEGHPPNLLELLKGELLREPQYTRRVFPDMRQLTARQKGEDGGWHYVSLGRHGGHPIGYCDQHEPHLTETEARQCYAAWLRDSIDLGHQTSWTGCEYPGCPAPTQRAASYARDGYHFVSLCPDHLTCEVVVELCRLDQPAGDSWVS